MKALSIEEIKQLKEDDYFWLVNINDANKNIYISNISYTKETLKGLDFYNYYRQMKWDNYGKTWVAYKNKEQADCQGEQIDLICKVGDTIYMPWVYYGVSNIAKCVVEMVQILDFGISYCTDLSDDCDAEDYLRKYNYGVFETSDFNIVWFTDEKLAEEKLKELQGEV